MTPGRESRPRDVARRRAGRTIARALALFALACSALVVLSRQVERSVARSEPLEELSYYPSGTWLRPAALGESSAWADVLWLRAVQYYGQHRETDNLFVKMAHVFDIITTLDPQFQNAYVFGGTSLCQEGKQFEAGVALLEKGVRNNPDAWIYPFELGFVNYVSRRNLTRATFDFAQAAREPDAPEYCQRFAAFSGQRAGYAEVALELWRQVAFTTSNSVMRNKACEQMRKLARGRPIERQVEVWIQSLEPLAGGRVLSSGRRP